MSAITAPPYFFPFIPKLFRISFKQPTHKTKKFSFTPFIKVERLVGTWNCSSDHLVQLSCIEEQQKLSSKQ